MSKSVETNFGKWQSILWPVHRSELKKLVPMLLIFFFISFNYNVLRTMKDSLIVTAKSSGAEVIPFIKVWVMFPMAIALTALYTYLANKWSREQVFYMIMGLFLGFFTLFACVLYPLRDALHPHAFADWLQTQVPEGLNGFVAMIRYWTFTSFYVMAELWSCLMLFTLFWGFANQVTRVNEAKRFYGLFGIGANFSGIIAGLCSMSLISYGHLVPLFNIAGEERWLFLQIGMLLISGGITVALFRWMHTEILTDPEYYDPSQAKADAKIKGKLSLRASFAYLAKSRYLLCLTVIVISYNVVINLVEVLWKHQVRELYPSSADYTFYMNQVMTAIGFVATMTSLFVSGNCIRRFGWTKTAMITPITLLITSVLFFYLFFCQRYELGLNTLFPILAATPAFVVHLGSLQNVLSRAAKYTVFDATKELAFVPLSAECKLKGKAAIDGVCSRLGKSGGSIIHQLLLVSFSSVVGSAPYLAISLLAIIGLWLVATSALGRQFQELTEEDQAGAQRVDLISQDQVLGEDSALQEHQAAV